MPRDVRYKTTKPFFTILVNNSATSSCVQLLPNHGNKCPFCRTVGRSRSRGLDGKHQAYGGAGLNEIRMCFVVVNWWWPGFASDPGLACECHPAKHHPASFPKGEQRKGSRNVRWVGRGGGGPGTAGAHRKKTRKKKFLCLGALE